MGIQVRPQAADPTYIRTASHEFTGTNRMHTEEMPDMPLMTWTEEMSVGVQSLDNDHKRLIELLNELHDGIQAGQANQTLEGVIDGLVRYTRFHFSREEKLFAEAGYPESAAHKAEHDQLSRRALNLQARFENGQSQELSLQAMEFLKSWLTEHIMGSDQKYKPFLNAKGIR